LTKHIKPNFKAEYELTSTMYKQSWQKVETGNKRVKKGSFNWRTGRSPYLSYQETDKFPATVLKQKALKNRNGLLSLVKRRERWVGFFITNPTVPFDFLKPCACI